MRTVCMRMVYVYILVGLHLALLFREDRDDLPSVQQHLGPTDLTRKDRVKEVDFLALFKKP